MNALSYEKIVTYLNHGALTLSMWVAKVKLKHDCIFASRTEKYHIVAHSYPLNDQEQGGKVKTISIHYLKGDPKSIKKFVADLKKDSRLEYLEVCDNILYVVDTQKDKPVTKTNRLMFFVTPAIHGVDGCEHWEVASYKKEVLMTWVKKIKPLVDEFELLSITNVSLKEVYFPKLLPKITDLQKTAVELAIKEGYYKIPKQSSIRALAKLMKLAPATYQKHLQKAEAKIIPDVLSSIE